MKTVMMALFGATAALALSAGGANATSTIIYDASPQQPNFSRVTLCSGTVPCGTWVDEIGPEFGFRSGGIGVEWGFTGGAISSVTFTLYTEFPFAGRQIGAQSTYIGFADLFIDLPPIGAQASPSFDYAIDFNSESIAVVPMQARLVKDPAFLTAQDLYANRPVNYGGLTNICSGSTNAECLADSRKPETKVTNGSGDFDLAVTDGGSVTLPAVTPDGVEQTFAHSYSVMLSGVDFSNWKTMRLFWGTGWCANDTVEGTAVVPVPAALPILGAALAGFAFAGFRQRRSF
ncbi:MAG: hypothetical protein MUE49_09905 [Rhodospirillales bacterium]|nr:hypothetical protein [Rhodospirillales bacterium]